MKIAEVRRHYVYVPYEPPVDPYWGWAAPTHGAHAVIVEVRTDEGLVGWGETAGRESVEHHTQVGDAVIGRDALQISLVAGDLKAAGHRPAAISGVEMALWDLLGKACDQPLHQLLGGAVRHRVPLCGLMGIKSPADAAETATEYADRWGFRTIKTKAGRSVEEDAGIARAMHEAVGDRARLRFDANQNYTLEETLDLAAVYRDCATEYIEQPLPRERLEELAILRGRIGVPVALNESVTDSRSVLRIAAAGAADALVPDIPDAGGILEVMRTASVAQAADLPCAHHCWHDLGIKTAAMAHVVAASPAFSLASDTTYHGLTGDVITEPFEIRDGAIDVPMGPGLGVEVDPAMLERFRKQVVE